MKNALLGSLLVLSLAACSSSSGGSSAGAGGSALGGLGAGGSGGSGGSPSEFATDLCAKFTSCNITLNTDCLSTFSAIVWGSDCESALLAATCDDLKATTTPPSLQVCFPPCAAPGTATCNGDGTLKECTSSGYYETVACTAVCATKSLTWSGTCDSMYMGQQSSTGSNVCWCK